MHRILVGYACNNFCTFCALGRLRDELPAVGDAAVRARIAEVLAPGADDRAVAWVGGEPTIFDELPAWLEAARAAGASWSLVQTNGRRLAEPGYAARLRASGADAVEIALHGSTAPMHDYHTQVEGSFAATLAGIARAHEAGLAVGVSTVVTRSSFRHLSELVRLCRERGVTDVSFAAVRPAGRARAGVDRLLPSPDMARPYVTRALELANKLGLRVATATSRGAAAPRPRFAGLGEVEPDSAPASAPAARRRLPVTGGQP